MKIKVLVLAFFCLFLQSSNLLAIGYAVTTTILHGQWISNCKFIEHSDPKDPQRGTYQKIFLEFSEQILSVNVAIHKAADISCSQETIFNAKSKYNYSLDGNITIQDNKFVTKLSATLIEDSKLFDARMKDILYFNDNKLYMGLEQDEDAIRYPESIDRQLFFTKTQ
jgi:hypothetical protein